MTTPEEKENAPIVCEERGSIFSHSHLLLRHPRTHTGEKPLTRNTCDKSFSHKQNLMTHLRKHTEEYPYSCETCGRSFSKDAYLRVHPCTTAMEKPCSCDTCGRSYCQKSHLSRHRLTHSGEIQFRGDVRGGSYSRRSAPYNHVVVRSVKGFYLCGLCGRNFPRAVNVISHHRRFHRRKEAPQENGAQGGGPSDMSDSSGLQLITSHLGGLQLFF